MFSRITLPVLLILAAASCGFSQALADGRWQSTKEGCQVWDALPQTDETVSWSGACVDGKASGHGVEVYRYTVDGVWKEERYVGEMRGGKLHGKGTQYYENGDRFDGTYADGVRVGRGTYLHANGDRYDGDFVDDKMTGRATFTYHAGGRYEGEFVNGFFAGLGTFVFADGSRYEGQFSYGLPNGTGTYRSADGETVSGNWSNGCYRQGEHTAAVGTSREKCGFE